MRFAIAIIAWLIAAPAWAFLPGQPVGMLNPQVQPANASAGLPAVDDNLAAGGYPIAGGICAEWGHQVPCNNHYSTTRASTKYVSASDGRYVSVPANVMAMGSGNGSLIEEARTNLALWSRDLTQGGTWIAVTMTAALNAVGIDGAANSASTLTSTSAAGTILQSLTQASAAYTYTVYVKGVTVTGAIQVADYPVLTPAFTTLSASNCTNAAGVGTAPATGQTGFLKCSVTATSLNPVIGFKFANSGDSIVADFNQLEAGSFGTSPMLTTSSTFTRSSDNTTVIGAAQAVMLSSQFTSITKISGLETVTSSLGAPAILYVGDDTINNRWATYVSGSATLTGRAVIATVGTNPSDPAGSIVVGPTKQVTGMQASNGTFSISLNGVSTSSAPSGLPTRTVARLGNNQGAVSFMDGYVYQNTLYRSFLPASTFSALASTP